MSEDYLLFEGIRSGLMGLRFNGSSAKGSFKHIG